MRLTFLGLASFLMAVCSAASLASRTLVVYDTNSSDSSAVKDYYVAQRSIPLANACGVSFPPGDEMTSTYYEANVRIPIQNCLNTVGKTNILYIVLAYVQPTRVNYTTPPQAYAVDSVIADIWNQYTSIPPYPVPGSPHRYFADNQSQGLSYAPFVSLANYRLQPKSTLIYSVWRLDGATAAVAEGLVDKAISAETNGLSGTGCFDRRYDDNYLRDVGDPFEIANGTAYAFGDWDVKRASEFVSSAGFSVTTDTTPDEFGQNGVPACPGPTALYSGWYTYFNYNDAFTWAPGAIGFHLDSASAFYPRVATNWSGGALAHGITVTSGSITEPYLEGLARPGGVYRDLLQGANVGDAFLRNTRWIKWVILNIGDPLYTPFPNGLTVVTSPATMTLTARAVLGGTSTTGKIQLSANAPPEGTTFSLNSSDSSATVPSSVTVSAGSSSASFTVGTTPVSSAHGAVITATSAALSVANTLTVDPLLSGVNVPYVISGTQTATGAVYLNSSAPAGGVTVLLSVDATTAVTVPPSVFIPAGKGSATFTFNTHPVDPSTQVLITATLGSTSSQYLFFVNQ